MPIYLQIIFSMQYVDNIVPDVHNAFIQKSMGFSLIFRKTHTSEEAERRKTWAF